MGRAVPFALSDVPAAAGADAAVRLWLLAVAGLVLLMITVGGATRLTGSGLSITEWQPVMGAIPPISDAAWLDAFSKYKAIPQYTQVNKGMSLDAFKFIFWWEWGHRFLGRLIGLAFALPMAWFWLRGRIRQDMKLPLLGLLVLGGLQGFIGWFMVSSGLSERVDVSQYRLALHLSMAFVLLGCLLWLAMRSAPPGNAIRLRTATGAQSRMAGAVLGLIFLQVVAGAFVAGLKAGLTYNTWPLMDGRLIPSGLGSMSPWYANLFENITAVQFNHRMLAYLVVAAVAWHGWQLIRSADDERLRVSAGVLMAAVLAQGIIGIWTLLWIVPLPLGLAHQGGAAVLFAIAVRHLFLVRAAVTPARASV
jgi:heme a synthase